MNKIIIQFGDETPPQVALARVEEVINRGRLSDEGKCYSYVTTFTDGTYVYADRLKSGTDKFRVSKRNT